MTRILLSKILELEGYRVAQAANGRVALELLADNEFDLILSDVMMPEISGLDLCWTCKQNAAFKSIPLILMTGSMSPSIYAACMQSNADAFLQKPFDAQTLIAMISNLMIEHRLNQI